MYTACAQYDSGQGHSQTFILFSSPTHKHNKNAIFNYSAGHLSLHNTYLGYVFLIAHIRQQFVYVILPECCHYVCTAVQHSYIILIYSCMVYGRAHKYYILQAGEEEHVTPICASAPGGIFERY